MIRFSVWGSGFLFYFLQWKSLTIFRINCAISGNLPFVTRALSLRKTRGGPGVRMSGQPGAPAEPDASKQHRGDSLERCPSELGLRARWDLWEKASDRQASRGPPLSQPQVQRWLNAQGYYKPGQNVLSRHQPALDIPWGHRKCRSCGL